MKTLLIEFVIVNFLLLLFVFAWVMKLRDAVEDTILEKPAALFIGLPAIIFDWYVNTFAATILFLDPPDGWEVVTGRLKRYKKQYKSRAKLNRIEKWRLWFAVYFCNLANRFDREHC